MKGPSLPISLVTSINPEPLVDISYVSQTDPVSMMNIKVVLSVVMNEFLNVKWMKPQVKTFLYGNPQFQERVSKRYE